MAVMKTDSSSPLHIFGLVLFQIGCSDPCSLSSLFGMFWLKDRVFRWYFCCLNLSNVPSVEWWCADAAYPSHFMLSCYTTWALLTRWLSVTLSLQKKISGLLTASSLHRFDNAFIKDNNQKQLRYFSHGISKKKTRRTNKKIVVIEKSEKEGKALRERDWYDVVSSFYRLPIEPPTIVMTCLTNMITPFV